MLAVPHTPLTGVGQFKIFDPRRGLLPVGVLMAYTDIVRFVPVLREAGTEKRYAWLKNQIKEEEKVIAYWKEKSKEFEKQDK